MNTSSTMTRFASVTAVATACASAPGSARHGERTESGNVDAGRRAAVRTSTCARRSAGVRRGMDVVGAAEVVVHHERTVRVVREVWEEKEKDEELEVTLDEDECGGPCVDPVGSLSGVGADPATPHWRQRKRRRHIVARPVDARSGYAQRGRGRRLRVTGGTGGGWRGRTAGKSGVACVQGRNALDRSLGADRSGADDGTADAEVPDTGTALFDGLGLTESTATPSDRTPPELPRCQGHSVPCRRVLSRRRSASGSAAYYVCARRPRCATFWWEREWLAQQTWRQQCTDATDTATDDETTAATSQAAPALFDLSYHHRLQDALQRLTGFSAFRTVQREAIEHLLRAESVIAVLPTAHGKSLLYQLAAALLPGTAVVITPLVSLMADQLKHMPAALSCACVHAQGMTAAEIRATYDALQRGAYKVLLVTPERFVSDAMVRVLQQTHVSRAARPAADASVCGVGADCHRHPTRYPVHSAHAASNAPSSPARRCATDRRTTHLFGVAPAGSPSGTGATAASPPGMVRPGGGVCAAATRCRSVGRLVAEPFGVGRQLSRRPAAGAAPSRAAAVYAESAAGGGGHGGVWHGPAQGRCARGGALERAA
eukprot:ctg_4370.g625